jgi:type I restriction-modification system DNA methylase subunit
MASVRGKAHGNMNTKAQASDTDHKKNPAAELSSHGTEKTDGTGRLCRRSLAVHDLAGEIHKGNQAHSLTQFALN